jgi:hypothetical protein
MILSFEAGVTRRASAIRNTTGKADPGRYGPFVCLSVCLRLPRGRPVSLMNPGICRCVHLRVFVLRCEGLWVRHDAHKLSFISCVAGAIARFS